MPYANPADRKLFEARRAKQRRADGLCQNCNRPALPERTRCQPCADRYAKPTQQRESAPETPAP